MADIVTSPAIDQVQPQIVVATATAIDEFEVPDILVKHCKVIVKKLLTYEVVKQNHKDLKESHDRKDWDKLKDKVKKQY